MMDAMYQRSSIRTFLNQQLTQSDESKVIHVLKRIDEMQGPYGHKIKTFFMKDNDPHDQNPIKVGTYGFIKNAPAYFGAVATNEKLHLIDFGYLMEYAILEMTKLNLGTVWLGGTFHRDQFKSFAGADGFIPAISPIGYMEKRRLREQITRKIVAADRRKPLSELVFLEHFDHPIQPKTFDDQKLIQCLECVQIAPSASNKQPWRMVINHRYIDFYLERTPNYANALPYDIQLLDMGIALCHMEFALLAHQIKYRFVSRLDVLKDDIKEYIMSIERI